MRINDLIEMSLRSLWRRKVRTALTILGVVIGACSIILMLSLGVAMEQAFERQLKGMANLTVIEVYPSYYGEDSDAPKLDKDALARFSMIPNVEMVIPQREIRAFLEFGNYRTTYEVNIRGLSSQELEALGYKVAKGTSFIQEGNEIIIGNDILTQFLKKGKKPNWENPPDPIEFKLGNDKIKIDVGQYDWETGKPAVGTNGKAVKVPQKTKATVVGVFGPEDWNNTYSVTVPIELYEELAKSRRTYEKTLFGKVNKEEQFNNIKVKVRDEDSVADVLDTLKNEGYQVFSPIDMLKEMGKISALIQGMLGGIGAISLLVAAIGIANTMMMSIYERTKEIGVMKVIGAKIVDIRRMFLVEAFMIGAIGGGVGVAFSYMLSYIANKVAAPLLSGMIATMGQDKVVISVIPLWLAIAALVFSAIIGLIAGYFPARRATQLSALSAIKTD